jgi:PEP-CTERM/exosortase A-associated glycosyltransferase
MRILHVLHTSLPVICGYSIRSASILRQQRRLGFDVSAVTSPQHPGSDHAVENIEGVPYQRTPPYRGPSVPFWREWRLMTSLEREIDAAIRRFKPDVVHAHSPVLVGLPALWSAGRHGLPLVYEVRDLWENASVDRGRFTANSVQYRIARAVETHLLKRASAVVTIGEVLRSELSRRVRDESSLFVVPNGVDADAFEALPADRGHGSDGGDSDDDVIVYVGTFQPYEGLDVLMRAVPIISRERPGVRLMIVGGSAGAADGAAAEPNGEGVRLRALVAELGIGQRVTFTGRVPHDQVRGYYGEASLVVYPRIPTRTTALTTPLKPLEAMAMGKAVLASDLPAMREVVLDGLTGVLFQAGDVIDLAARCVNLLADRARRETLGAHAAEWVRRERDWPAVIRRYIDIYETAGRHPAGMSLVSRARRAVRR